MGRTHYSVTKQLEYLSPDKNNALITIQTLKMVNLANRAFDAELLAKTVYIAHSKNTKIED